jgi:DNA-binding SARP family transcriptional activator
MPEVSIRTFGSFAVQVSGEQVPVSAWQSRVAREILAMIAVSRRRPLHREVVIDRLWPEEDMSKAANRLSVALSTIRGVLDPGRRHDPNRYLISDRESLRLDERNLEVDVDAFFETAERGRALLRSGSAEQGLALLRAAEARYVGELLEDQPYAEWAIGIREEARSEFMSIAATLAEADVAAGDHDGAARWNLRIIEQDPYNEPAHLSLVRSMVAVGRHGTARRLYGVYVARMSELDVEPEAFPARG